MTVPFESYAKLIRTTAPLVRKVLFYDGDSHPAWISDGVEEPELRSAVEQLTEQRSDFKDDVVAFTIGGDGAPETLFLFTIRGPRGGLAGLLGVVCRHSSGVGRTEITPRLLAPVLDIYRHSIAVAEPAPAPVAKPIPRIAVRTPVAAVTRPGMDIYDKVLRQAAAEIDCSFTAIVMPGSGLNRYYRVSEKESDFSVDAAVQNVQAAIFKWMTLKRQPTAINRTGGTNLTTARHKLAVAPILDPTGQVLGLMMVFRDPYAYDFESRDVESVRIAGESLSASMPHHATSAQIRRALADDHFRLYAQRISPLRKHSRSARFEVLLRMQEADALYTPESFLDVARADRLMPEIDRWVVRHSLQKLTSHAQLLGDRNVEFCINVDEQSLITPGFGDFVVAELSDCAVPADLLVFEIPELALKKQAAVESFAGRVSAAGCRLSLDNFGAGSSVLSNLSRLHISSVKIDGPMVRDVTTNRRSESWVRDVASMTASMQIESVAGHVEQDSVRDKLRTLGIDYAQGFALSPPRPVDEALTELEYLGQAGSIRQTVVEPELTLTLA